MCDDELPENGEEIKIVYDQCGTMHRYFLDWRYKLLAGYVAIISAIGYFIFTWVQKPSNYSFTLYLFVCLIGVIISLIFALLSHRLTKLIWKCQNVAYLTENQMKIKNGLYGNLLSNDIKTKLDNNVSINELSRSTFRNHFNPLNHTGILNWFFILVMIAFISLLGNVDTLRTEKTKWENRQELLFQKKIENNIATHNKTNSAYAKSCAADWRRWVLWS